MSILPAKATVRTAMVGGLYSGALGCLLSFVSHNPRFPEAAANILWVVYVVVGFVVPVAYCAVGRQYLRMVVGKRSNQPFTEAFAEAALRMLTMFGCAALFPVGAGLSLLLR